MDKREVEFLWQASRSIPSSSQSSGPLASYLLSKCRKYDSYGAIHLPKSVFKDSVTCKFCSNTWKERQYQVRVLPRKTVGKSIKRMLRRHERDPGSLRKYEKSFVERFQNNSNKLVLTCPVCSKRSDWPLHRRNPPTPAPEPAEVLTKRKKKKRAKDRLCGLKISLSEPKDKQGKQNFVAPPSPLIVPDLGQAVHQPSSKNQSSTQSSSLRNTPKILNNPVANKNKKANTLNKSVLKKMLVKTTARNSLKDFLSSLP